MKTLSWLVLIMLVVVQSAAASDQATVNPRVALVTSKGRIVIELYPRKAPATVKNFLSYVDAGFYDGTVFHRVIPKFMIQGGGLTADMKKKPSEKPVPNEADNNLKNTRGSVAMARTGDPHSATSQFFINTADNDFLNYRAKTPQGWGYAVFGRVSEGMTVVDAISDVNTGNSGMFQNVPIEPVVIEKVQRVK
ncbi:MAG: peptidylprolyl isomerase [Desulfobacterales bacterium]|jgi:cyclophilin family peptidyl-prolyl cis-trans isomerase